MSPAKKTATKKATTRKTTRRKRGPAEPRGPDARESALDHRRVLPGQDEHALAHARGPYIAAWPAAARPAGSIGADRQSVV